MPDTTVLLFVSLVLATPDNEVRLSGALSLKRQMRKEDGGMVGWRDGGTVGWWDGGTVGWWDGGIV